MYLTKEQLQDAGIDPEKIQRFSELFLNGTEVMYARSSLRLWQGRIGS